MIVSKQTIVAAWEFLVVAIPVNLSKRCLYTPPSCSTLNQSALAFHKGEIIVIGKDRGKVGTIPKEAVEETTSLMQHLRRSS